jgi:GT2 family glycosyltransferase
MAAFLPEIIVAIPTYWTWEDGKPRPEDAIYDHPTPLSQEGTLARLLESLKGIEGPEFRVLIITAATNPQLEEAAEAKVNGILKPFRSSFPIAQFAASGLAILRKRLDHLGFPEAMISLRGYGNVRNIQLIAAHIIGSQIIVGLDDDEIVTDKDYLQKAVEFIGSTDNGEFVGAVAGFYLDSEGRNKNTVKDVGAPEGNPFYNKSAIMNAAIEVMEEKPGRLVETSFVFGGNMVIHRRVFEEISFDPYITRGEDIDYLINARLAGYHFFFDKELAIVHLPPLATSHLQEDIIRFIYEKEKLTMAKQELGLTPVSPESLDPYPGAFLHNGMDGHASEALHQRKLPKRIVDNAMSYARETVPRYFKFRKDWPRLMRMLGDDEVVRARVTRKFERSKSEWN